MYCQTKVKSYVNWLLKLYEQSAEYSTQISTSN